MKTVRQFIAFPFVLVLFVAVGISLVFGYLAHLIEGPQ